MNGRKSQGREVKSKRRKAEGKRRKAKSKAKGKGGEKNSSRKTSRDPWKQTKLKSDQ